MLLRYLIGAALRRMRHDRGLTLESLAKLSSVSLPYLSEIERGRKEASSEVLASVCAALGVTLDELLDEIRRLVEEAGTLPRRRRRHEPTGGAATVVRVMRPRRAATPSLGRRPTPRCDRHAPPHLWHAPGRRLIDVRC